jgi:DNA-binding MarR family transcriptional regulator
MKNMQTLIQKLYRMVNLAIKEMETPWIYGVDFPLHHAEVHLLEVIKSQEGANVSTLASHLGITSGAVSQVTRKLLAKGLIEAYRKPDNRKEVFSRLTALGTRVCKGHEKHHANMVADLRAFMDRLSDEKTLAVHDFLDAVSLSIERKIAQAESKD